MNNLAKTLLGGTALCALATASAMAGNVPNVHIVALHAGNVVDKSVVHDPSRQHLTYTLGVSTYVPASDMDTEVKLTNTFYFWRTDNYCSGGGPEPTHQKVKVRKKSTYAQLGRATETYSYGCTDGPAVFYGDTYTLTNPAGEGQTDHFVSTLIGKFRQFDMNYKGTLNLDVSVAIGK